MPKSDNSKADSSQAETTPSGPFTPGDPRIWKGGQKSKDSVRFTTELRQAFVDKANETIIISRGKGLKKTVEEKTRFQALVDTIWDLALKGNTWAIQFIAEKVEGKVPNVIDIFAQSVDLTQLSDDKLRRLAQGEDLIAVLTS